MSDEPMLPEDGRKEHVSSVQHIANLDAFLEHIVAEQRPKGRTVDEQELADRILAAQLRLAHEGVEQPSATFLHELEKKVLQRGREVPLPRRAPVSRNRFLRSLATLAGGAGLGVAGIEGVAHFTEPTRPTELVAADNEHWYEIAAAEEVPPGGLKAFAAGGVLGFLLNDNGNVHAVSAICTHMGCKLKPKAGELHCLCHSSRFSRRGEVRHGLAPTSLPQIALRVENGQIYALGTKETV